MNIPKGFKPEKGIEEKTDQLMKGPTIHQDDDLDLKVEELLKMKEYSYIIYEGLTFHELSNYISHPDQKYWLLSCKFEYKGRGFHVHHINEQSKKGYTIFLESSNGETMRRFKKVLKKILKYNKKEHSNRIERNSEIKIRTTPFPSNKSHFEKYEIEFKIDSIHFKNDFETTFLKFYNREFQNTRVKYVTLQNITHEEFQKTPYPRNKITNKIEKEHP